MMRTMWRIAVPGLFFSLSLFLGACSDDDGPTVPTPDTRPGITSIVPAGGATISPDTEAIVITFNRPIDEETLVPPEIGAEFFWLIATTEEEPFWNEESTVLTIPLPVPLPAGMPLWMTLAGYSDTGGVVQPNATHWSVTVAGTPDYYPLIDGRVMSYWGSFERGEVDIDDPDESGEFSRHFRYEVQDGGLFHLVEFEDEEDRHGYQIMNLTATALQMHGFHSPDDGDVLFVPSIDYLLLQPSADATWASEADIQAGGETVGGITTYGAWVRRHDRLRANPDDDDMGIYWTHVWEATLRYVMTMGGDETNAGSMNLYFAPGIGLVKESSEEEDYSRDPAMWHRRTMLLVSPDMD